MSVLKCGSECVYMFVFVCVFLDLSVCLSLRDSVCLCVCVFVCVSVCEYGCVAECVCSSVWPSIPLRKIGCVFNKYVSTRHDINS